MAEELKKGAQTGVLTRCCPTPIKYTYTYLGISLLAMASYDPLPLRAWSPPWCGGVPNYGSPGRPEAVPSGLPCPVVSPKSQMHDFVSCPN